VKYWVEISRIAASNGFNVLLPWGSEEEKQRAEQIIKESGSGELLPRLSLGELKDRLSGASGVVGVDSGLAHLAAALSVPAVTLYGPTRTDLTGAKGLFQINLQAEFECAPCMLKNCEYKGSSDVTPACFGNVSPDMVWGALQSQMGKV
jgi:heptosyltransferase-1